ncbi:hypothetical protein V6N12_054913 [Hibiscus sabdariffa]|uniref:AAA+ ATPase domain-containing protein n=1 Tax=Hibiscus sabdariffa TaxID=183260 RepID=A0ABR2D1U5_9ROSI
MIVAKMALCSYPYLRLHSISFRFDPSDGHNPHPNPLFSSTMRRRLKTRISNSNSNPLNIKCCASTSQSNSQSSSPPPPPFEDGGDQRKFSDLNILYRRFWKVAAPYWYSDDKVQARLQLAGVFALTLATTGISVGFNFLGRDFFNALANKDQEQFTKQLVYYLCGFAGGIPFFVLRDYARETLSLRWRCWMTSYFMQRYLTDRTFYKIQSQSIIDNPDQRIVDDLSSFTSTALSFSLTLFNAAVDLISFSNILYTIYPPLFVVLLLYSIGGTVISIFLGKGLVSLNFLQEKKEADFRYGLVRVRENAESIAFYGGEDNELQLLLQRFTSAFENLTQLLISSRNLEFFTNGYRYLIQVVPVAVVAPMYFSGKIEFGVINQSVSAFSHILGDVSLVVYQFQAISAFSAVIDRLGEFDDVLDTSRSNSLSDTGEYINLTYSHVKGSQVLDSNGSLPPTTSPRLLDVENLILKTPKTNSTLVRDLSFVINEKDNLLVVGPSGSGKTSLLRALAGLWSTGKGKITFYAENQGDAQPLSSSDVAPVEENSEKNVNQEFGRPINSNSRSVFFLPQRPYMVLGSLRQQLLYPTWAEESSVSDTTKPGGPLPFLTRVPNSKSAGEKRSIRVPTTDELTQVLEDVRLGYILSRFKGLDTVYEWSSVLSLGEQQRLAFARLLLSKPKLALLDESTSALDEANEAHLYEKMKAAGITPLLPKMAASSACLLGNGLSTHGTKSKLSRDFYGKHIAVTPSISSLGRRSNGVLVKASLKPKQHEGRREFLRSLLGSAGIGVPALLGNGKAYADEQGVSSSRMSYSRFLEYLDKDRVKKVDLFENGTIAIVEAVSPELGNRVQRVRVQLPGFSQELLQKFREKNIDFAAHNGQEESGSLLFNLIGNLAFPLILIGGLFLLSRRSSGGMGGPGGPGFPLAFGQSKAKFQMEPSTGVTFDDVAGVDEAKQDFMEVVEFLKKPERFTAVGARIPKGVLLIGPPGTGKTLLAKAIAGEAGVPFFSISGSEFVEMFVGVGASRVRDLFKKAKENAPCIVFVDEIDAVGRQRGTGIGGGNDEREQTLNQLLTEMDGFEGNTGVIVIAATNRVDILDSALLRPGRFDRQVSVDVPDIRGRTEILKVHGSNKKFDADVSFDVIAMRTPGFSGADLANLLNEAAILAGRRGKTAISSKEIDDSIDRIVAGMEGTVMTDGKSKSLVAYHEVGHAICGTLTPGHDAVQKVTLVPRGQARGLTWFIPSDDPTLISKQQLFARIVGGLGGRAAEEVIFGEPEVTTGAAGDLQQITGLAKQMVVTFGMSEIGPWSLMDSSAQSADVIMRMMARNSMSEKLAEDIDAAVKRISDNAYEIALSHIRNNREAIDKIVDVLLEKETMSGDEFRAILSEFVEIPAENQVPPAVPSPVSV